MFKQYHLIKYYPLMEKENKVDSLDDFQLVPRKGSNQKNKAPNKFKLNNNKFSPLLVEINHPLIEVLELPLMDHAHIVNPL